MDTTLSIYEKIHISESPYLRIFHAVEFLLDVVGILDTPLILFNLFTIFQRKGFTKLTGILFDVSEGMLTLKTA